MLLWLLVLDVTEERDMGIIKKKKGYGKRKRGDGDWRGGKEYV